MSTGAVDLWEIKSDFILGVHIPRGDRHSNSDGGNWSQNRTKRARWPWEGMCNPERPGGNGRLSTFPFSLSFPRIHSAR